MLLLYLVSICLVASCTVFRVEAEASSVRISTVPSQGPFRVGQSVQFSCEVEPSQSEPVSYNWRTVEYPSIVTSYSTKSVTRSYSDDSLRYCWYFCSVTLNGIIVGSANKLVEVHGLLHTDEPITRVFSLDQQMVMRINISDGPLAQFISSLVWHHNGTELTSDDRIRITNNGTSLTISNMTESDAGKYEVNVYSLGSDPEICDRTIPSMLKNVALLAPVTFLLQESNLPTYNPEDVILDYALPAYQGIPYQTFAIDHNFMVYAAAVLNVAGIYDALIRDGISISERNVYNITVSYDNITTQSLRITYNNTDDIAGHYLHTGYTYFIDINREICPGYYGHLRNFFPYDFPIFTIYWKIRSYDTVRGGIKRGANPPRLYDSGCPIERDNEDILEDVLQLLLSEFGVVPLGRAKSYAAMSCQEVAAASARNKAGLYWITDGTNTQEEYCHF